jgi:cation:H+ antiporter
MAVTIVLFFVGLGLLIGGAELFVRGSSRLAARIGVSSLVIGLTVVSFGTSAPELAISIQSGLNGQTDLLLGNIIGSNIFNVLFILGVSALITPLVVDQKLVRQDVPLMIGCALLLWAISLDGDINKVEAAGFIVLLLAYIGLLIYQSRRESNEQVKQEYDAEYGVPEASHSRHWIVYVMFILGGLGLLVLGARWLVQSAVEIAQYMGLSSVIIGLTIVSAGTSLPEVATSVLAGLKGERDIAVGNVVGSNIFNILCILGISGVVLPGSIAVPTSILAFDLPVMIAISVACLPIFFTGYTIARWEGFVFLGYYLAYTVYLILGAQQHDMLPLYNSVMLWFVIPLTVLTLLIVVWRELKTYRSNAKADKRSVEA